jgi:hypothetical protein
MHGEASAVGHRVEGVFDQVAGDLVDARAGDGGHPRIVVKVGQHHHAVPVGEVGERLESVFNGAVDVAAFTDGGGVATEGEQVGDDAGHAQQPGAGLLEIAVEFFQWVRVGGLLRLGQQTLSQTEIAEAAVERVVELMGDPGCQATDAGHGFGVGQGLAQLGERSDILHDGDQLASTGRAGQTEVESQAALVRKHVTDFGKVAGGPVRASAGGQLVPGRVRWGARSPPPLRPPIFAGPEQLMGGAIALTDTVACAEHQHRDREQIQQSVDGIRCRRVGGWGVGFRGAHGRIRR